MPEFLTNATVVERIEETIASSGEFVYLICPYLYEMPLSTLKQLKAAGERGVSTTIIYKKGLAVNGKEIVKLTNIENLSIYSAENIHAKAYFSEREAIVTSFNLLSGEGTYSLEFGVAFSKQEHPDLYAKLFDESQKLVKLARQMRIEDSKLAEIPIVRPKIVRTQQEKIPEGLSIPNKRLTPKEKHALILELFAKECADCQVKVEDNERLRIPGSGIVVFVNKERVEIIFVRYTTFNQIKEEVREYILSGHPGLQVWVNYNRIIVQAEQSEEVAMLFMTVKDAVKAFNLA